MYLSNRTQFVQLNGSCSKSSVVTRGVPQGSVLGPILFLLYTSDLTRLVDAHNLQVHLYTRTTHRCTASVIQRIQLVFRMPCLPVSTTYLRGWEATARSWTPQRLKWCGVRLVDACTRFPPYRFVSGRQCYASQLRSRSRRSSGHWCVHDDTHLRTTASCFCILSQLRSIQRSLPRHAVVSLVTSLVLTKLDYCNSLLVGLPAKLLNWLHAIINTAARLVCHAMKADHITPVLKDIHWLRIQERIQYKLCVTAFKCQHSLAPPYLSDQLQQVVRMEPRQRLRSSSSPALVVPATRRSSLADRAFLVAAARAWNSLASTVTAASTLHLFSRALKTHLFTASFPPP